MSPRDAKRVMKNSSWLINRADASILMSRTIAEQFPQVNARVVCNRFMRDAQTTLYHGVEFNPEGTTEGFRNLWIGHTIKPVKGDWEMLANYLFSVICSNNQQSNEYLLNYLAHALQKPGRAGSDGDLAGERRDWQINFSLSVKLDSECHLYASS